MAPVVETYALGPTQTNCYAIRAEAGGRDAVVVDPGYDELRLDGTVSAILVTHCHWDHLGGIAPLAESSGAPVYMPEREAQVLENPEAFFPGQQIPPYRPDVRVNGGDRVEAGALAFDVVDVPGHSPGHVAYAVDGAVFSGDVLFAGSVGRTDLPFADWDTLFESIAMLFDRFPPETIVYPGHGPPTTLAAERARNPFLTELRAS